MLEALFLSIAMSVAQDASPPSQQDVGTGADAMTDPATLPLTVHPGLGKGLRMPVTDRVQTDVNHKKGAQDRGATSLRSLIRDAGSPNKVLPHHVVLSLGRGHSIFEHDTLTAPLNEAASLLRALGSDVHVTFEPAGRIDLERSTAGQRQTEQSSQATQVQPTGSRACGSRSN